jgi:uncharacterized membrane protein YagU involved in acid resistance
MSSIEAKSVVNLYKNLFISLSVVTLLGIAVVYVHLPVSIAIILAIIFMLIKTGIVYKLFAQFLKAKLGLRILFGLSIFFFFCVILLPVLTYKNHLNGTVDISKELAQQELSTTKDTHHGH